MGSTTRRNFLARTTVAVGGLAMNPFSAIAQDTETVQPINPFGEALIAEAQKFLGTDYQWNGRGTTKNPDMDCYGLLFRAYAQIFNENWTKYPVNPIQTAKDTRFGNPVKGLGGILREEIHESTFDLFQPGDFIYFLRTLDPSDNHDLYVVTINDREYGAKHTAMSLGQENIIHADPYTTRKVSQEPLLNINFDALFVTRRNKK
jgi:cell wall-associated NlpC family hydrolase